MARLKFSAEAGHRLTTYAANPQSRGGIPVSSAVGRIGSGVRETILSPDSSHVVVDDHNSRVIFGISVPPVDMYHLDTLITAGNGDLQGTLGPGQQAEVAPGVIAQDLRPRRRY